MIFNSFKFLIFFLIFFFLYWFVFKKNVKIQNIFLLISSYLFYCFADWRFLAYLIEVSALNYILAIQIEKENKYKNLFVWLGIAHGVLGLAYFKYFNFFIESFNDLFQAINLSFSLHTLNILMPLGISFFTFRVISYLLDVEKGKIDATQDIVVFFNYVAFFPSILAGPIDKARDLVPQLEKQRVFKYEQGFDAMRQILWGLFKKVVIANNCAVFVNQIFDNYADLSGSTLVLGIFLYAFQIYGDFSGYSDMAIGIGKLMGFNITQNFNYPFFAQNIADFWRRWHISLTTWLTEYVFTPLSISFRNLGKLGLVFAIILDFLICGIWHGANWTFVVWGALNGIYFIPLILSNKNINKLKVVAKNKFFPSLKELGLMFITFCLTLFSWIFFRAENLEHAFNYIAKMFSMSIFEIPQFVGLYKAVAVILLIGIFVFIEWIGRENQYAIEKIGLKWKLVYRWSFYFFIISIIFIFSGHEQQFIYFQY